MEVRGIQALAETDIDYGTHHNNCQIHFDVKGKRRFFRLDYKNRVETEAWLPPKQWRKLKEIVDMAVKQLEQEIGRKTLEFKEG